ncbi:DNA ligase [Actinidia chinensis var. chinensis]|uniref:DNA ligase n=1 Tax=Actinidia chinensis var. chinensis TaxID=1590841 RepID=A0A2R6Q5R5_ACTCC|nr:DNA ligase [Actinidia chinensis var. chinensis]
MGELQDQGPEQPPRTPPLASESESLDAVSPPPPPASSHDSPPPAPPRFDPSRMIGIIRRKSLIKDLAAVYHVECLAYCQELLELQRKWEEPYTDLKTPENSRKEQMRPAKHPKKSR